MIDAHFGTIEEIERREYLTILPQDIEFVRSCIDMVLPNQPMLLKNGIAHYQAVSHGVTAKGAKWVNAHRCRRENTSNEVRPKALPWLVGDGIDIGCGIEKIVPECIGVDSNADYGDRSDADDVRDATDLTGYADGQFDWLYSAGCLEHIPDYESAFKEWVRVVRKGGVLYLYLPWPDRFKYHSKKYESGHQFDPSPSILTDMFRMCGVGVLEVDSEPDDWMCFTIIGRKR